MRKLRPRVSSYVALLLACALCSIASAQPIKVTVVNGKTGKLRSKVRVYIVLDDPKRQNLLDLKTDQGGTVQFESGDAKTFQVRPVGEVACGEPERDYSVDMVMSRGTVTKNDCGKLSLQQNPGHLTYFTRSATWWELFRN